MKRKPLLLALFAVGTATPAFAQYTFTTLASFNGSNGANPVGGLILSNDGSTLYGTTYEGGADGNGTVFSLPIAGGTPATVAAFNGTDGAYPIAGLILSGSVLYGTTTSGGHGYGTVFSLPASGGTPAVLASFINANGSNPCGSLILSGGTLYGTTMGRSSSIGGNATLFSLPVTGGIPTVLASFSNHGPPTTGFGGSLILSGSTFYGTTLTGGLGIVSTGTVFSLPITGGTPTTLAAFNHTNGNFPQPGLILACNTLYDTSPGAMPDTVSIDGPSGPGTLFSLSVTGGTPTTLATLNGNNGNVYCPCAGLLLSGGTLYGTTNGDGAYDNGTVFSVPLTGGAPTVLYSFTGDLDGSDSAGSLIADANGDLYGTTEHGGAYGDGTVFELSPVPEPASLSLLVLGGVSLLARRRQRTMKNEIERCRKSGAQTGALTGYLPPGRKGCGPALQA